MAIASGTSAEVGKSDPIITRLANEDKKWFFRKPHLLYLYLMLFPTCMGIELTSGFDSQMINALQNVPSWIKCTCLAADPSIMPAAPQLYHGYQALTGRALQTSTTLKAPSRALLLRPTRSAPFCPFL